LAINNVPEMRQIQALSNWLCPIQICDQ